jgi:hypothetical protein
VGVASRSGVPPPRPLTSGPVVLQAAGEVEEGLKDGEFGQVLNQRRSRPAGASAAWAALDTGTHLRWPALLQLLLIVSTHFHPLTSHLADGAEGGSKPVIKELLVSCFDAADNPEDAFLRDFVQGQQWRDDDQPAGEHAFQRKPCSFISCRTVTPSTTAEAATKSRDAKGMRSDVHVPQLRGRSCVCQSLYIC